MLDPTDATLRVYERRAEVYTAASSRDVDPEVMTLLVAVLARLPSGSRVLEVGSGPGLEADYLEQQGLIVDRTDAAAAFVRRLQARGHNARLLDVRSGDLGGPYDAVLANAVFLHLDRAEAARAFAACRAATRSGGLLALTLKQGDGESWSSAKVGEARWFVYWRDEALKDVLHQAGWLVVSMRSVQGRTEPWLHVLCEA